MCISCDPAILLLDSQLLEPATEDMSNKAKEAHLVKEKEGKKRGNKLNVPTE